MKIAVLTPVSRGGPYIWGAHLVQELRKNGYEAEHICTYFGLFKTIFHTDADIVHTTVPLFTSLWDKPIVISVKGDYRIEKRLWRLFYPLAIRHATVRTCSTKFLKHKLGLDNAIIIPNAVDTERFNLWRKHRDEKRVSVVTMTKFRFKDKSEGVLNIANALMLIDPPIRWTILGGGEYLEEYKQKIRQLVGEKFPINFLGFVEKPEIELPKHDIFAYYSVHDSFATAVIEAMACGLPVVTNNYGPAHEIIKDGENGFVRDGDKYAYTIKDLVEDWELRKRIGILARKTINKEFNWQIVTKRYIELYERIKHGK